MCLGFGSGNYRPQSQEEINTQFFLYTQENNLSGQPLIVNSYENITNSHFNPKFDTKIIVHGFKDSHTPGGWMETFKDEFLIKDNFNVIIIDWSGGNGLLYGQV